MNPIDYFDQGCRLAPDALCLRDVSNGVELSYRQVRDLTLRAAAGLASAGFDKTSHIAVLSPNGAYAYTAVLSVLRLGAVWLPVNPRYAHDDLARCLRDFHCDVLIYHSGFADLVAQYRDSLPGIKLFLCLDRADGAVHSFLDWLPQGVPDAAPMPHDAEAVFAIQPTGGTTGRSKGVMIPARSLETTVASFLYCFPPRGRPVFLAVAPLTHAAGMVGQSILACGGEIVIFKAIDKQELLQALPLYRITHTFLPPTVIYELLREPNVRQIDYTALQYLIYGAAPMSPDRLAEAIEVFGPCMAQIYSQTEMAVPATFMAPQDHFRQGHVAPRDRLGSCGRPSAFVKLSIQDETGRHLPAGEVGEICMAGNGMMLGYYRDPEATQAVMRDGWLLTGDVGFCDADGFFYITDRKKDMIITGGFNVYSVEVEHALHAHPDVAECAVIGVPHPKWGEAIHAVIVPRAGASLEPDALIGWAKTRIGSLKAPKSVSFAAQLPKSPVGKVLKRDLRHALLMSGVQT